MSIELADEVLHLHGQVVRQQSHGPRWLLSMSFEDVTDRDADQLRRRLFQALRGERALAG